MHPAQDRAMRSNSPVLSKETQTVLLLLAAPALLQCKHTLPDEQGFCRFSIGDPFPEDRALYTGYRPPTEKRETQGQRDARMPGKNQPVSYIFPAASRPDFGILFADALGHTSRRGQMAASRTRSATLPRS